jgi:hypothetical protein
MSLSMLPSLIVCTAQHAYTGVLHENQLSFPAGALIITPAGQEPGWWWGSFQGQQGYFPSYYVSVETIRPPEAEETPRISNRLVKTPLSEDAVSTSSSSNKSSRSSQRSLRASSKADFGEPMGTKSGKSEIDWISSSGSTFGSSSTAARAYGTEGSPEATMSRKTTDTDTDTSENRDDPHVHRFVKGVLTLPPGQTYVHKYASEPRKMNTLNALRQAPSNALHHRSKSITQAEYSSKIKSTTPAVSVTISDLSKQLEPASDEYVTIKEHKRPGQNIRDALGKTMQLKGVGKSLRSTLQKGRKVGTF